MNNLNKSELFEEKNEIKNINDFIKRQNEITKLFESWVYVWENNKANNSSNHEALYQKIITMKTILESHYNKEIDPIDYLYKKYFDENLSVASIYNHLIEIYSKQNYTKWYLYKSFAWLQKLFTWVLNWKLRNQKQNKTTDVYKEREKPKELVKKNEKTKEQRKIEFLKWFIENSNEITTNFDNSELEKFKFKWEKLKYILENYFKISDNWLKKLKELSIWTVSISNYLNETFKDRSINFQSTNYDLNKLIS